MTDTTTASGQAGEPLGLGCNEQLGQGSEALTTWRAKMECKHGTHEPCDLCAEEDAEHDREMAIQACIDAAVAAERERCASKCRRPVGWLSDAQQQVVDEILRAIESGA